MEDAVSCFSVHEHIFFRTLHNWFVCALQNCWRFLPKAVSLSHIDINSSVIWNLVEHCGIILKKKNKTEVYLLVEVGVYKAPSRSGRV